jgi:MFS transporter, FHS family, L-fucose permease
MIAAIVGGAIIPLAQGKLADTIGLHHAFALPAICYAYIACLGIAAIRRRAVNLAEPAHLIGL